jgi:serine/threonine-protein kinase
MEGHALLQPGTVVDVYTVERVLGRGGMATVYAVRHERLGSLHALKLLDIPSPSIRARLEQEGRVQASLRHPNIVSVQNIVTWQGCPGLVMEYVDGLDLDALLRLRKLSVPQADALAMGVIRGVRAAHRAGLVHRDLKPANVLLARTPEGLVPKVNDFGLAKVLDTEVDAGRTRSGQVFGTPQYMAPEQFRDSKSADARSDLWSLGCLLYEMVAGKRPFEGADMFDIHQRVSTGAFTPLEEVVPDLPERMGRAVGACLQVDRGARVPDCDVLLELWRGARTTWEAGRPAAAPLADLDANLAALHTPATYAPDDESTGELVAVGVSAEEVDADRERTAAVGPASTLASAWSLEPAVGPTLVASERPAGATLVAPDVPALADSAGAADSPPRPAARGGAPWLWVISGVAGSGLVVVALGVGLALALRALDAAPEAPVSAAPELGVLAPSPAVDAAAPAPEASPEAPATEAIEAAPQAPPSPALVDAPKLEPAPRRAPAPATTGVPAAGPPKPAAAAPEPAPSPAAPAPVVVADPPPAAPAPVVAADPPPAPTAETGPPRLRVAGVSDDRVSLRDAARKYFWPGDAVPPGEYQIFLDDLHFAGSVTVRAGQPRLLVQCIAETKECR